MMTKLSLVHLMETEPSPHYVFFYLIHNKRTISISTSLAEIVMEKFDFKRLKNKDFKEYSGKITQQVLDFLEKEKLK